MSDDRLRALGAALSTAFEAERARLRATDHDGRDLGHFTSELLAEAERDPFAILAQAFTPVPHLRNSAVDAAAIYARRAEEARAAAGELAPTGPAPAGRDLDALAGEVYARRARAMGQEP